ncbi:MAG: AAA family ATPase [Alphaproteobacteria bacterium]|nr:MAG: hypothetical protein B6I23_02515 [Rickettsiaceae bacterium 4572_127]
MLSSIKIKNFKSIVDLKVDFSYAETAPSGYKNSETLHFLPSNSPNREKRIAPVMMFYGANASGKSNILKAIFFIKLILQNGLKQEYYHPNKLKNLENETLIEMEFFIDNIKYKYLLAYNNNSITKEELLKKGDLIYKIHNKKSSFKKLTKGIYKNKYFMDVFETACLKKDINTNEEYQINTFLSNMTTKLPSLSESLNKVFSFFNNKLKITDSYIDGDYIIKDLARSNSNADIQDSFNKITSFIKKVDIDIKRATLSVKGKKSFEIGRISQSSIDFYHENENKKEVLFKFHEESNGTRLLFGLAGAVIKALETGGVLLFDEMDNSIHPLVLKNIIRMFKDKEYNNKNAQLITTLHNTIMLEDKLYRVSEFAFVNKNLKNGTFVKRLSDLETRNDLNFRKNYLGGYFQGVPYPFI